VSEPGPPGKVLKRVKITFKFLLFLRGWLVGCSAKQVLKNYCFSLGTCDPLSLSGQQSLQRDWKEYRRFLRGTCILRKVHGNPEMQAQEWRHSCPSLSPIFF